MDETKLKKDLAAAVAFVEEYQVQWKALAELDGERQILDIEEYGITSTCHIRERLFAISKADQCQEVSIPCRKVRKKHYGDDVPVDTPGEPLHKFRTGEEKAILIVHSSFLTQPKGPHQFTKIIEAYQ
jgi:hypothetical protein